MYSKEFTNRMIQAALSGEVWIAVVGSKDGNEGLVEITDHRVPRVALQKSKAVNGEVCNTSEMVYRFLPKCRATHLGACDGEYSEPYWVFPLATPKDYKEGDTLVLEPGDLILKVPNGSL